MRWTIFILLTCGCGQVERQTEPLPLYEFRPGQVEVMNFVWHEAYGMPDDVPPPPIVWVDGVECGGPTGPGIPVKTDSGSLCSGGTYQNGIVTLLRYLPVDETGIPHEYMHAMLEYTTGNADGRHQRPEWKWIPVTNRAIRNMLHSVL